MYDTTNTRLAAALKTLGFTLVSWDVGDGQTIFHFEDNVKFGKNADGYNKIWRDGQWHEYNQSHPFAHIVKVAEARDWIINKVIHGEYQEVGGEDKPSYFVYDISIAACIIAHGYYLLRFTTRRFYFIEEVQQIHKKFLAPERDSALWWQRSYLQRLRTLMELVPRQKNVLDKGCVTA